MSENKKANIGAGDIILLIVSAAFLLGVLTVFGACGPKDDGSWMTCHWAQVSTAGIAAVLLVISVAHLIVRDSKIKVGIDIAAIPLAVLAAITPGTLISLCMMNTMQCQAVMRPATIVMSVLVIAASLFDIVRQRSAGLPKRQL